MINPQKISAIKYKTNLSTYNLLCKARNNINNGPKTRNAVMSELILVLNTVFKKAKIRKCSRRVCSV